MKSLMKKSKVDIDELIFNRNIFPMILLLIFLSFSFEEYEEFRFVKSRLKPCSNLRRCSLRSCSSTKYLSNGIIDIKKLKETNTGYKGKSKWMEIYGKCSTEELYKLVSGIHFGVSVHIAKNFTKFLWWYLPNPLHLKMKYKEEHEKNFFELYDFVKAAVLKEGSVQLKFNLEDFKFFIIQKKIRSSISKMSSSDFPKMFNFKVCISDLKKILSLINCIDCDKCRVLGNLQFEGLKEAMKVLSGRKISKEGFIYLVLLFRKLSRTILDIQNLRMNSLLSLFLWYFDYFVYFALIFIFVRLILIFYSQNERIKREDSKRSQEIEVYEESTLLPEDGTE